VKDYQYLMNDGSVGMTFIPVSDFESVIAPDNRSVKNYSVLDDYLRKCMGLGPNDQIYALISYAHLERNCGTPVQFLTTVDKTEFGITHVAAYLGYGRTSNAYMMYHNNRFCVGRNQSAFGYPSNVQIVSIDGIPQSEFNKNAALADFCLNTGVMFPYDYWTAPFRAININTALMFYRDWLRRESYLFDDSSWYTYCVAHKTLVLTIAANLPHNPDSFKEVYGEQDGTELFKLFVRQYNAIYAPDTGFVPEAYTHFEPLWKKQGFTADQIRPFTKQEYDAYETARREKSLPSFKGFQPLNPDQAVIWPPQSMAEIVFCFIQIYADFLDVGAVISSTMIINFMKSVVFRTGMTQSQYIYTCMPIIEELMFADARVNASAQKDTYLQDRFQMLYIAFGGKDTVKDNVLDLIKKLGNDSKTLSDFLTSEPLPAALSVWALVKADRHWQEILDAGSVTPEAAYDDMMKSIIENIDTAEDYVVTDPAKVQYNVFPAIVHQICIGMHSAGKFVNVKEVCTIMDMSELELKKRS
jgi:hypothetical protein